MKVPDFLSLDEVLAVHRDQLDLFGGTDGVRDPDGLDAALAAPINVFYYLAGCDLYDMAAAYAYSLSEGQPFLDGNKRTGLNAALLFLVMNGAKLPRDGGGQLYSAMIAVAHGNLTRAGLADVFRRLV
jgi:death-on-curing protein